jgi:hypothetical protein
MPTDSPEVPGPRKRKLSTKVATNGDPAVERKRKKLEAQKQSTKPAHTQKNSSTVTQAPAKIKTTTKAATKSTPQLRRPSVEIEEIEDDSELDDGTSVPPRNP